MGCGASSAVQVAPIDDNHVIAGESNRKKHLDSKNVVAINGCPPKAGFKFAFFPNKINVISNKESVITISIGIQTESDINGIKTQYTQTDFTLFPEDELELMMNDSNHYESDEESNVCNKSSNDFDSDNVEVDKSVLLQTDGSHDRRNVKKISSKVTIDVGIQVKRSKITSATQTRICLINSQVVPNVLNSKKFMNSRNIKHSTNLRKAINVDIESCRLWTAPSKIQDVNSLDVESLNLLKSNFQDFESQTDPLLSTVLAANSAGNDLTVLQSYDISSPFAHIEKELLYSSKNSFKNKVPDNILQDSLNRLLEDMDDSFTAKRG
jgi:uncharacterized metal-binding protein